MFGNFTNTLKKLFGDKSEKDLKELKPYAAKTNEEFKKLGNVSNDELRAHTMRLQQQIRDYIAADEAEIEELKKEAEASMPGT